MHVEQIVTANTLRELHVTNMVVQVRTQGKQGKKGKANEQKRGEQGTSWPACSCPTRKNAYTKNTQYQLKLIRALET